MTSRLKSAFFLQLMNHMKFISVSIVFMELFMLKQIKFMKFGMK